MATRSGRIIESGRPANRPTEEETRMRIGKRSDLARTRTPGCCRLKLKAAFRWLGYGVTLVLVGFVLSGCERQTPAGEEKTSSAAPPPNAAAVPAKPEV